MTVVSPERRVHSIAGRVAPGHSSFLAVAPPAPIAEEKNRGLPDDRNDPRTAMIGPGAHGPMHRISNEEHAGDAAVNDRFATSVATDDLGQRRSTRSAESTRPCSVPWLSSSASR